MQINQNTLIYSFAAVAALVAYKALKPTGAASSGSIFDMFTGQRKASGAAIPQNTQKLTEILSGSNGGDGWKYWDDGEFTYGLSPSGTYYINGEAV